MYGGGEKNVKHRPIVPFCTLDCGHLNWQDEDASSREKAIDLIENLLSMLKSCAQIYEKLEIEISFNVIVHMEKRVIEDNRKGKGIVP